MALERTNFGIFFFTGRRNFEIPYSPAAHIMTYLCEIILAIVEEILNFHILRFLQND